MRRHLIVKWCVSIFFFFLEFLVDLREASKLATRVSHVARCHTTIRMIIVIASKYLADEERGILDA